MCKLSEAFLVFTHKETEIYDLVHKISGQRERGENKRELVCTISLPGWLQETRLDLASSSQKKETSFGFARWGVQAHALGHTLLLFQACWQEAVLETARTLTCTHVGHQYYA